ncbi:MAG: hypothetical protein WC356_06570 [Candidatus Micrarchaeia archaeon]|jgi:hypothetical protein
MGGCKLLIILYISLFITLSYANSFQPLNDNFEPNFWEDESWMCNNALRLCWPFEVLEPRYVQSLASSNLDEIEVISDLSSFNAFTKAKTELDNAQDNLVLGKNSLKVFKNPICVDIFTQVHSVILNCEERGGTFSTSGCRVKEGNETEVYPYRVEAVCVFEYLSMPGEYKKVLTNYIATLEHSTKAVNYIYSDVNEEFLKLENLGAGYNNYFGGAKQIYTQAKQVHDAMSFQSTTGINPNSLSFQYSSAYQEVLDVREELIQSPSGPNFNFLNALPINSLIGKQNSLAIKGIELYEDIVEAQNIIIDEFTILNEETETNQKKAADALNLLKIQKIELIDSVPAEYTIQNIETPEDSNSLGYLDWNLVSIYSNLNSIKQDADSNYTQVKNYRTTGSDNLGEGIEKLHFANTRFVLINENAQLLLEEFENLNLWMKEKARNKLLECDAKLQNTSQSSRAFAMVYREEAQNSSITNKQTIGEQYILYKEAYDSAKECVDICEGKEFLYFDSLLSEFNRVILAAEKDGLTVSSYKDWYNFYKTYNYGITDLVLIKDDINNFINEIYAIAYSEYEEQLTSKRAVIKQNLYSMYSYDKDLINEKNLFEKWEPYYKNNHIDYTKALGNLKNILNDYNKILDSLEDKKPDILKQKFENEYKIQENWKSIPILDEPVDLDILVIFQNPTDLSYDSYVLVEIPFDYEVYSSDIIYKSDNINRVSKDKDNLLIEFSKIDSREKSEIKFHLDAKLFKRISYSDTIIESVPEYQKIRKVVTFNADIPVNLLYSFENIPEDAVSTSTEINGIEKKTTNLGEKAKIELNDIEKGKTIYHFYYILENRSVSQNISQNNYLEEYQDIYEDIVSLEDTANLLEQNNLTQDSTELINILDEASLILDESKYDFNLGKFSEAFDKLKKARNLTESFDLFSSLQFLRESLSDEFNSLNSVWIRSGNTDFEISDLMTTIEDNLVKLRSLTLSKEDIPLLGQTNSLLELLKTKIGNKGESTLTSLSQEIINAKTISSDFENKIYPEYKIYYNSLKSYKVEGNVLLSFPYTSTELDSKLKAIKKDILDIEEKIDNDPNQVLSDITYLSNFRESVREFNITKNAVELIVIGVDDKIHNYINKTEQSIVILNSRELNADSKNKLNLLSEDLSKTREYLEKEDKVEAFKLSSKAYYDALRLLSGTNPGINSNDEQSSPILLISIASIFLILIIGGLFFFKNSAHKKEKPIEIVKLSRED